jgi:hypothetical protein
MEVINGVWPVAVSQVLTEDQRGERRSEVAASTNAGKELDAVRRIVLIFENATATACAISSVFTT